MIMNMVDVDVSKCIHCSNPVFIFFPPFFSKAFNKLNAVNDKNISINHLNNCDWIETFWKVECILVLVPACVHLYSVPSVFTINLYLQNQKYVIPYGYKELNKGIFQLENMQRLQKVTFLIHFCSFSYPFCSL